MAWVWFPCHRLQKEPTLIFAEILGPDLLIILVIVALLFGGSRLPKLARSLGSAKSEFEHGVRDGAADTEAAPPKPEET